MLQAISGILTRCPVKDQVPDFPCPGHYKHSDFTNNLWKAHPCKKAEHLCSLGVFTNTLHSPLNDKSGSLVENNSPCDCSHTQERLRKILLKIATQNVDKILSLGNIIKADEFAKAKDIEDSLALVASMFADSFVQVLPCIGDQETSIREHYMRSALAKVFREYGLIKQPYRCCGEAYYSARIGPEGVLVVLDGYELLVPEFDHVSESTKSSLKVDIPKGMKMGRKCIRCEANLGNTPQVGWYTELQPEGYSLHPDDLKRLPPIRSAISEQQLQWLYRQLQEATRSTDNVIVACHVPLHPLLVRDRTALPINWKQVLRVLLQFTCVRCVLQGRPMIESAQPPDPNKPYQLDHNILYYSIPSVWGSTETDSSILPHMIVEIGYDFLRIKGERLPIPPEWEAQSQWTILFEPKRKLSAD